MKKKNSVGIIAGMAVLAVCGLDLSELPNLIAYCIPIVMFVLILIGISNDKQGDKID